MSLNDVQSEHTDDGLVDSEEVSGDEKLKISMYTNPAMDSGSEAYEQSTSNDSNVKQILGYGFKSPKTRLNSPVKPILNKSVSSSTSSNESLASGILSHINQADLEWNTKFQTVVDALPDDFDFDNISVHKGFFVELLRLTKDFVHLAELYGKIIISEKELPDEYKTILPLDTDIHVAGTKYVKRGIMFKFCKAEHTHLENSDDLFSKVLSHEFKGLLSFMNNCYTGIHFPLMALIDYRGYRISAMTILPISRSTLVYGSLDQGNSIIKSDNLATSMIEEICQSMNLKGHMAGKEIQNFIYTPTDIEVHKGTDNNYYAINFARAVPPEYGRHKTQLDYLVHRLRPEFVRKYNTPLSSDAFSPMGFHDQLIHNNEVKAATHYLLHESIVEFTERFESYLSQDINNISIRNLAGLQSTLQHNVYKKAQTILISEMHREGINLRYMGKIRRITKNRVLKRVILVEMISRVLKNTLRCKWRNLMKKNPESEEESYKHITAKFLNLALGSTNESSIYWQFHVKPEIVTKFVDGLDNKERHIDAKIRDLELLKSVFLRVLDMCHVVIAYPLHQRISKDPTWLNQPQPIRALDIIAIDTKIKTLNTIPFVEGLLLLDSLKGLKSDKDKNWILKTSLQKFNEALLVVPGGKDENMACAKVLYKRARLGQVQLGKAIRLLEMAQHSLEYLRSVWENDSYSLYLYAKTLDALGYLKNSPRIIKLGIEQYEKYMGKGDWKAYYRCCRAYFSLYHLDSKNREHIEKAFSLIKRAISSESNHPGVNNLFAEILFHMNFENTSYFAECDNAFTRAHTLSPNNQMIVYLWATKIFQRSEITGSIDHLLIAGNKFDYALSSERKLDLYKSAHKVLQRLIKYRDSLISEKGHAKSSVSSLITSLSNSINRCLIKSGIPHDMIIDYSKISLYFPIGNSSVSFVFKAGYKKSRNRPAIEVIAKILRRNLASAYDVDSFELDISTLLNLGPHPNIVVLLGKCYVGDMEMMIQESCGNGSIKHFFTNHYVGIVPWDVVMNFALGAAQGLLFMHSKGYIHNFINSYSILIMKDKTNTPKLSNFMHSVNPSTQRLNLERQEIESDDKIPYYAPERIARGEVSYKTDVYAFGLTLWEIGYCGRANLFEEINHRKLKDHIVHGGRPMMPERWNIKYRNLIAACVAHDPDARPSMSEVVDKLKDIIETEDLSHEDYAPPPTFSKITKKRRNRRASSFGSSSTSNVSTDEDDDSEHTSEYL